MAKGCRWCWVFACLLLPSVLSGMDLKKDAVWEYAVAGSGHSPADADRLRFTPLPGFERLHALVPGEIGFLWVRAVFRLPDDSTRSPDLGLLTSTVYAADSMWLNGRRLGGGGRFPPRFYNDWNGVRLWRIEPRPQGFDTLLVLLYVHREGAISGRVEIGDLRALASEQRVLRFIGRELNLGLSLLLLMIALHHLLIFARRPKDSFQGYYALLCFSFSIYLTNFYATLVPGFVESGISYLAFQKLVFVGLYLSAFSLGLFVSRFLGRQEPEWFRYLYGLLFALVALLLLGAPDFGVFSMVRLRATGVLLVPAVYVLYILGASVYRRQREVLPLLIGFVPLLGATLFDLVVREWMRVPGIYFTGFGTPAFIVAMLIVLSLRFVRNANEAERLNQELELDVIVRTNQLKEANLHLERTMLDLREANRRLEGLVVTDSLTHVHNRRAFDQRYEEAFARARRQGQPLSVLMVDIDHFKLVNDTCGHLCGDQCIVAVATALQECLRRSTDILARYGGEEFVVLLPETDSVKAAGLAEAMRERVEAMSVAHEDHLLRVTVSIGVACAVPGTGFDRGALLARADASLYEAKTHGRNRVVVADDRARGSLDALDAGL